MDASVSRKILLQLTMAIVIGGASTGCSQTAFFGEPAVPLGYSGIIPDIDTKVYFYFYANGSPDVVNFLSSNDLDGNSVFPTVEGLEIYLNSVSGEFGVQISFGNVDDLDHVVYAINKSGHGLPVEVEAVGPKINILGVSGWSQELKTAWNSDERVPVQKHIAGADITLRLLPRSPPFEPIVLGFVESPSDHIDTVMTWVGLNLPEFGDSIGLMNIDVLVIAGYSDREVSVIDRGSGKGLSFGPVGVIGVGRTSYPGVTLDILLGRFADRIGLDRTIVEGEEAYYLQVRGNKHFFMKNYGPALFFCFAGSYDDALSLMKSVIANQE